MGKYVIVLAIFLFPVRTYSWVDKMTILPVENYLIYIWSLCLALSLQSFRPNWVIWLEWNISWTVENSVSEFLPNQVQSLLIVPEYNSFSKWNTSDLRMRRPSYVSKRGKYRPNTFIFSIFSHILMWAV